MTGLSDRAKQLIPKARIVSFESWKDLPSDAIAIFQRADDERTYLSDEDLASLSAQGAIAKLPAANGSATTVVKLLRDQAPDIIDEARGDVLKSFPGILEPGGGLCPPVRADACWRDFWQFLRCITYGIAGGHDHYTSAEGLQAMEQLYEELKVPLPAMVQGIKGLKAASLSRFEADVQSAIAPQFDHLIHQLSTFLP
ncbi:MAG: phycobilisome protein [Cyanobacteria bacterium J06598_3]